MKKYVISGVRSGGEFYLHRDYINDSQFINCWCSNRATTFSTFIEGHLELEKVKSGEYPYSIENLSVKEEPEGWFRNERIPNKSYKP